MSEQRKRLTAEEQKQFVDLCAAQCVIESDPLKKRIQRIKQGPMMLGGIKSNLQRILTAVMDTMPYEQLVSYQKQMQHIAIYAGVKRIGNEDDWDGRYLTFTQINALLEGCIDHCLMCDKEVATIKKCAIRKIMNTVPAEALCWKLEC